MVIGTKQVAKMLGVSVTKLQRALWDERLDPPIKGPGGVFLWTIEDVNRASWVLLRRAFEPPPDVLALVAGSGIVA